MNQVSIQNNRVYINGNEIKYVKDYTLKASADSKMVNELQMTVLVQDTTVEYNKELPARANDLAPVIYEIVDVLAKHKVIARSLDTVLDAVRQEALSRTHIQDSWVNDVFIGNKS